MKASESERGIVYLVGAGPGDPGLLTVRGAECLRQADVVIYDRLANHALLDYAEHADLIDAGKEPEHHAVPQGKINALLLEHAQAGKIVVRLKGGDPFVFGRGGEEAEALAAAGIPFVVVPGVSSAIAGPAYAGIPVTHRGLAASVTVATGHRAACADDPACDWRRLAAGSDTLIYLMGVRNLPHIVAATLEAGRPASTPIAVIQEATCAGQRTVVGTLVDIVDLAAGIEPPAVIIIGDVVNLRETLSWYESAGGIPAVAPSLLPSEVS
ncbi:MAG TPA: uroporphyrinogen-III C-methyltransferase [Anaerolineae bacterium]